MIEKKNSSADSTLVRFRANWHDIKNLRNKEEWNNIKVGIEQH